MAKTKVALVVDVKNWAFDNIAQQIKLYLADTFEIEIIYPLEDFPDFHHFYTYLLTNNFKIIHFFWRPHLKNFLNYQFLKELPIDFEKVLVTLAQTAITTSIYDHLFLEPEFIESYKPLFLNVVDKYTVSSQKLESIYRDQYPASSPAMVIQDGVNLSLFHQQKDSQVLKNTKKKLVVGWAGNSKWGKDDKDSKGLHSIIKPAIQNLINKGYDVSSNFADRNVRFIPLTEMNDYYHKIDVYVCASDIEGTPNPVLEAMACGVPVVSTDVGIVPEVFGALQKNFIFDRTTSALQKKLEELLHSTSLRQHLSKENLIRIKQFTREKESEKWRKFFIDLQPEQPVPIQTLLTKMAKLSRYLLQNQPSPHAKKWQLKLKNKYKVFFGIEKI